MQAAAGVPAAARRYLDVIRDRVGRSLTHVRATGLLDLEVDRRAIVVTARPLDNLRHAVDGLRGVGSYVSKD